MTPTAEVGLALSMPGNLALATLPPTGGSTGGPTPSAIAIAPLPVVTASVVK